MAKRDTRAEILAAAEQLLRRHGPHKWTVTDVARHLEMSHANVYRHFASKQVLLDEIARLWLHQVSGPLLETATGAGSASQRLRAWLIQLHRLKVAKVKDDPEMFAVYHEVAAGAREVVAQHVGELQRQLCHIISQGGETHEFRALDVEATAIAIMQATAPFHHPSMLAAVVDLPTEEQLGRVIDLLLAGMRTTASETAAR